MCFRLGDGGGSNAEMQVRRKRVREEEEVEMGVETNCPNNDRIMGTIVGTIFIHNTRISGYSSKIVPKFIYKHN